MNPEDNLRELMRRAETRGAVSDAGWNDFVRRAHRALYVRRAVATVSAVGVLAVAVVGAGTFLSQDELRPPPPATSPSGTASPEASEAPPPSTRERAEVEIWITDGERLSWGTLIVDPAPGAPEGEDDDARAAAFAQPAMEALLAEPSGPSAESGYDTAIPEGTELLGITSEGRVATVDLSSEFESGGGSLSMRMRVAQVVYTLTQFRAIEGVSFAIDGEPVTAIGGEGVIVDPPRTRADYYDFAPPILLENPRPGDEVTSPVTVAGTADVFEATVNIQILDANGDVLTETFTTATCSMGCRGDYEKAVDFEVDVAQEGRVVAFWYSAEDGSPTDAISIPVMLVP